MNFKRSGLIIFLALLLLSSCSDYIMLKKQNILFGVHYINYAWGYTSKGIMIDSAGCVYSFNLKNGQEWKDSSVISNTEMIRNMQLAVKTTQLISEDSLNYFIKKANQAVAGKLSEPQYVMADAGIVRFYAFFYDSKNKSYKQVLLYQWGDEQITNSSSEAIETKNWLFRIYYSGISD